MPVFVEQRPANSEELDHFSRVLRDDPDQRQRLAEQLDTGEASLYAGVFNGAPVALVVVTGSPARISQLVVHPATRNRGVATEVLRLLARQLPGLMAPASLATLAARAGIPAATD